MKKWTVLLVILITKISHAMDITCDVISCNYSDPTKISSQTVSSSGAYISSNLGETLNINLYNDSPKLMMSVTNPTDINLTQTYRNTTAANTHTIISSKAGGLSVTAKGIKGINGVNSSKLCADRFKIGTYGAAATTHFNSRHLSSSDTCDDTDITYLKNNNFSCDEGYIESSTSDVSLAIANQKRACRADITYNVCAKKSYDLSCRYYVSGPICCDDTNPKTFSSWTKIIFPNLTFLDNCHADACTSEQNGIYFSKTIRGYGETGKTVSACNANISDLTASFLGGGILRSITSTATSTTRNSIDLSESVVIKNNDGTTLDSSDYRLMPVNIDTLKAASAEFKNCFGLDGSDETDYVCDIKPGPTITIKLAAIRISDGHYSNEISIDVSGNKYAKTLTTNQYKYYIYINQTNYTHKLDQTNVVITYNDNTTSTMPGYVSDKVDAGSTNGYTRLDTSSIIGMIFDANGSFLYDKKDYPNAFYPFFENNYFVMYSCGPALSCLQLANWNSSFAISNIPMPNQLNSIAADTFNMFPTFYTSNSQTIYNYGWQASGPMNAWTFPATSSSTQTNVILYADYNGAFPY